MVKKKKQQIQKEDKQFFIVVAIITLLIISIIVGPIIYKRFFATFEYGGVKFEKAKLGQITFYHGMFPINYMGKTYSIHNVYFRTDPRKNDVEINTDLVLSRNVLVSLSKDIQQCSDIQIAQTTLGSFISAFPFVQNVSGGILESDYANETGLPHITCNNAKDGTIVLIVKSSDEKSIEKIGNNCYEFNVGNCEYLPVVERFIIGSMAQINEVEI